MVASADLASDPVFTAAEAGFAVSLARVEADCSSPAFAGFGLAAGFLALERAVRPVGFAAGAVSLDLRVVVDFVAAFGAVLAVLPDAARVVFFGAGFAAVTGFPGFAAVRRFDAVCGFSSAFGFALSGFAEVAD